MACYSSGERVEWPGMPLREVSGAAHMHQQGGWGREIETKTDAGMKKHECAFVSVMEEYKGRRRPGLHILHSLHYIYKYHTLHILHILNILYIQV